MAHPIGLRVGGGPADTRTMRTRKPAATARGNSCGRCTAVLPREAHLCALCGWPAGVGYPPVDGEVEAAAAAAEVAAEPEPDIAAEESATQLDALAGMAERRTEQPDEPTTEATDDTAEAADEPDEAPAAEAETTDAEDTEIDEVAPTEADAADDADVDPLTAPLTGIDTEDGATLEQATPIAAVAAAAAHEATQQHTTAAEHNTTTPAAAVGRASSLARPVQLLVVGAAVLNGVLAALYLAFGKPIDDSMSSLALGLSMFTLGVWAGATITFLYWVSRAYVTVVAESVHDPRHGPTLSLAGWLIPVAGLFIGYRVLQDLWVGSDPQTRRDSSAKISNARLIDVWLLGIVTAFLFSVLPFALGDSALWGAVAALGVLVAGLALAAVVGKVSDWQDQADLLTPPAATSAASADEGTVTTRVDGLEDEPQVEDEQKPEPVTASAE